MTTLLAATAQIWLQPPGTPAMGMAFLRAYEATGDARQLDAAKAAADALARSQLESGGWDNLVDFDPARSRAWYRRGDIGRISAAEAAKRKNVTTFDSNRPIYGDRDGKIKYRIEDLSPERQTGYSWKGDYGVPSVISYYESVKKTGREATLAKRQASAEKAKTAAAKASRVKTLEPRVREILAALPITCATACLPPHTRCKSSPRMSAPTLHTVHGQPSWSFRSAQVEAHLTRLGGHLAPVTFHLGRQSLSPFSIAPWAEEKLPAGTPALLSALRGDFFCAPFGGNGVPWRGEQHPPHGETANAAWRLEAFERSAEKQTLHARLELGVRRGVADKFITLIEGHAAVYQCHVLTARGPMSIGHHAMLKFPEQPGSGVVSTSRFTHAQVLPDLFERPEARGYSALKPGAVFRSLDRVPLHTGGMADLTTFPARRGFDDLVMLSADPKLPFAWTAATFAAERFVYFALRDPRALRHTILWMSNGGRHYEPWNGRHTAVMGIEDTTSYFHYGLAESAKPNPLSRRGIPTTITLNPKKPAVVNYIIGVAAIPAGFDRVKEIRPSSDGIDLQASSGRRVRAPLDLGFLNG